MLEAQELLASDDIHARVVSMPSQELFAAQPEDYRAGVLPAGVPRISLEAGHTMSWYRWVGDDGVAIGLDRFGASAPWKVIYEQLGLTAANVVAAANRLAGKPA